jgi:hypothetical protein
LLLISARGYLKASPTSFPVLGYFYEWTVEKERSADLKRTSFLLGRNPYGLAKAYLAIVYADGKTADWIRADPGFISDAGTLSAVIGERQKDTVIAFKAFWEILLHTFPTSLFPRLMRGS